MTKAWLEAGFQSEQVDLDGRKLAFKRVTTDSQSPTVAAKPIRIGASRQAVGCSAGREAALCRPATDVTPRAC